MASRKFDKLIERGEDFLRYLKTENININGKNKEDVKELYNNNYKEYRSQIYPNDGNVRFSSIFFILTHFGYLHLKKNRLYLRPQKSAGQTCQPAAPKENIPSTRKKLESAQPGQGQGRSRPPRVAIAVDQFLTAKNQPQPTVRKSNQADDKKGPFYTCKICEVICHSEITYKEHLRGKRHRARELATSLHENREQLSKNKGGVTISALVKGHNTPITDDSVSMAMTENIESEILFMIMNNNTDEDVLFVNCQMLNRDHSFTLHDEKKVTYGIVKLKIQPGQRYTVHLTAKAAHVGTFHTMLAFQFYNKSNPGETFHIMRSVHAECSNKLTEELKPKSEYKRPPRVAGRQNLGIEIVIEGVRPPGLQSNSLEKVIALEQYPVPRLVRKLVNRGLNEDNSKTLPPEEVEQLQDLQSLLEEPLGFTNYAKKFQLLNNVEEMQLEVDIRRYDLDEVTMTKYNKGRISLLLLEVPGLAEKRPSLLKGDVVFARINTAGKLSSKEYKGYVHEVRLSDIAVGFDNSLMLQFLPNMRFNVRFTVNRFPLLMGYRAVKLAQELSLEDILFPSQSACTRGTILPLEEATKYMHDGTICTNPKQLQAIQHIVCGSSRPAPYILFGPPGTGKTVTIVEAMKQIVRCIPTAHILACAPSNSAADLIASRLIKHLSPQQVFRMYAPSRPWKLVPEDIKAVSNYDQPSGEYFYPTKAVVMNYRVVVCTLVSAGRLVSASFPPGHFTHVFIDEAGNAPEPEGIVPIAGVLENLPQIKDGGQLVLAGDPKQLGPIIHSPIAKQHGLGMSLLERLMMLDIYARQDPKTHKDLYNPNLITKLLNNYRSHEKILAKVNEMFYNGELIPCADPILSNRFCRWEMLPTRGFPIIFHGVSGREMREEQSPSFFNPEEVAIVLHYVKNLLEGNFPGFKVQPNHIGIISPYKKQVEKLKQVINRQNWAGIKVGSTEEYQGDERAVIIVSTVRSQSRFLSMDSHFRLGFLDNPKRFNVAVTRAKALLIIVGNPFILRRDSNWNSFLEYCQSEGGYTGLPIQPEEEDLEDFLQRFAAVGLSNSKQAPQS